MGHRTDLSQAYFDLATMMEAGMPILRSIDVVIEGRRGHLKQVFKRIHETISKGASVAEALGQHPRMFPDLDCMLIEAAETSGALVTSLSTLADWHRFVHRITAKMLAAMIYPIVILHIGMFVAHAPGAILGGATLAGYLLAVLRSLMFFYIPAAVIIALILLRERAPLLRWPLDVVVLRIPLLGLAVYHMSVSRYARAFGMLYGSGVPVIETTERATRATGNVVVARQFEGGNATVRAGGTVGEGFSQRIPNEYRQLWQVGEETGELDKITDKIAEIAGDRADLYFTAFAKWFPILVYVIVSIVLIIKIFGLYGQVYGNLGAF